MLKRKLMALMMAVTVIFVMSGCGASGETPEKPAESGKVETQERDATDNDVEEEEADDEAAAKSDAKKTDDKYAEYEEAMQGEWEMICEMYSYSYGDKVNSYLEMADKDSGTSGNISIYEDNGKIVADYKLSAMESLTAVYGAPLSVRDGKLYDECANDKWYAAFDRQWDENSEYGLTLIDEDTLTLQIHTVDKEYEYESDSIVTYGRKGSKVLENREDFRYLNTVTVSTVSELLAAIDDNTKILLKSGDYNMTNADLREASAEFVSRDSYSGEICIKNVNSMMIAAEEGADVNVSIDDPYSAVLMFSNCPNLSLDGLTCGHNVEPGYCSGAVIRLDSVNNLSIRNCNLFGSGTYGIEALNTYNASIADTDIYECTYGLICCHNCGNFTFENVDFRDSVQFNMFEMNSCYDFTYKNCTISDNASDSEYSYFMSARDADSIVFANCIFRGNSYVNFADDMEPLTFSNCKFDKDPR